MPVAYLSKEWLAEARRLIDSSDEFREAIKGMTGSLLNIITDAPKLGTIYAYYRFTDGRIDNLELGADPKLSTRAAEIRATGAYATYALLNQGKMGTMEAVLTRKLKLEGDLKKALRYAKPMEVINRLLRSIPTVY